MEARPGDIDRSTLGHPGKFSFCVAEDEEDTTWLPLAQPAWSAAGGLGRDGHGGRRAAADHERMDDRAEGNPGDLRRRNARQPAALLDLQAGNYALIIPKQLREHLQAAGWSKHDIASFIHQRARIHRREWAEWGKAAVVRDRGDSDLSGARFTRPASCRRRGRSGRRFRRGHPAMARQQEPGGDGRRRRLC